MTALPPANDPAPAPLLLDEFAVLADVLRQAPDLAARVLQVHRPDREGWCRATPFGDDERHRWPCRFYDAATNPVTATEAVQPGSPYRMTQG